MVELEEETREEPKVQGIPVRSIPPLEQRIWEIVKKNQAGHKQVPKTIVLEELGRWCHSENLSIISGKEYGQAIYNLTHGQTPSLHCTEITYLNGGKEVTEYFSWED